MKIKNSKLHKLGLKIQPHIPHSVQKALLPLYMGLNAEKEIELSEEDREYVEVIKETYEEQNEKLDDLLPKHDLSSWN